MQIIIYLLVSVVLGGLFGYQLRKILVTRKAREAEILASKILEEANSKKKEVILNAKDEAMKIVSEAKNEENKRREHPEKVLWSFLILSQWKLR